MPHQCVKCSRIISVGSKELIEGCLDCKGHFFFYIRDDQLEKIRNQSIDIPQKDREQIEKDVREIVGVPEEDMPVILDLESIRIKGDGKFELDIVKIFRKDRPLIYKLEEGKYIIDLASTLRQSAADLKEIVNPDIEEPDE